MLTAIPLFLIVTTCIECFAIPNNSRSENVSAANYSALLRASQTLSKRFDEAVLNELGTNIHLTLMPYASKSNQETIDHIAKRIDVKITTAIKILTDMKSIVANKTTPSFTHPCQLSTFKKLSSPIEDKELIGSTIQFSKDRQSTKWNTLFKDLRVKRQYFLSTVDYATDLDCALMPQSSLRHLYHKIFHPHPKWLIFFLDSSTTNTALQKSITIIKEVINLLQPTDTLTFKLLCDKEYFRFYSECGLEDYVHIGNATENNKLMLLEYLSNLNVTSTKTVEKTLLPLQHKQKRVPVILTDVSNERRAVIFAKELGYLQNVSSISIVISQSDDGKQFPKPNLEKQSFHGLNVIYFNKEFTAGQVATQLISTIPAVTMSDIDIVTITPYWDATQRDFLIPLMIPLHNKGLIGLDLFLTDVAEDIVYFKRLNITTRAFLLDKNMNVLFHSFFPRPDVSAEKIKFPHLIFAENENYSFDLTKTLLQNNAGSASYNAINGNLTYTWKWIKNMFLVCLVSEKDKNNFNETVENSRSTREILYHRLDLFPPKSGKICRHFKQLSTLEQGTVYLSPSSFASPSSYLHDMNGGHDSAITYMQNYVAYLKGVAFQYLSNPGLKPEVRNDVNALNPLLLYFKKQHFHGPYNSYIVRRYAVAESGVLIMYPGTVLEFDYEPVKRPWYASAIENPGKITLTTPSLDVGGAGYIVTISYAIKSTPSSSFVVMAMDVTMGFLYKMLLDSFPHCNELDTKCFIMNNRGYLISHPGLMDPYATGPVEQQHITHKESLIASDMLNHKGFVVKQVCNSFPDKTLQRFYEFNTTLEGVLSNIISGDHWVHYYVSAIHGTNAFVAVVNATVNIFCPCNRDGRICLNCNRMEQNECECPCECNYDTCDERTVVEETRHIPLCSPVPENNIHKSHYFYNYAENLAPCFESQCESYSTYSACLGVMGCEWCQLDTDARTILSSPFCTSQSTCFSGVLGAVTPYGEGTFGRVTSNDVFNSYSAIGPVAGCVVTLCLIVVISIYCYKQNTTSASCRDLYADGPIDNWPEQDLQLSQMQSDDHGDVSGHDRLLPALAPEAPISPYKILTGYRRPNTTGDSDHGYSTMTPHEDSEATAFSMSDPLAALDNSSTSDVASSISSRPKQVSKTKIADPSVTMINCGINNVLAPVTVHRNMEAS